VPSEFPFDGGLGVVGALVPCRGFCGEFIEGSDSSLAEALPAEETDFDLGLVEPASVLRGVVDREPAPQSASVTLAEPVRRRLAGVGREVVEHQVDGTRRTMFGSAQFKSDVWVGNQLAAVGEAVRMRSYSLQGKESRFEPR